MLWLIERYPYLLAMEMLKTYKQYNNRNDMFQILEDDIIDYIDIINVNNDVIISTLNNVNRNIDGTLAIKADRDINISGCRLINNNIAIIELFFDIQMSVPRTIKPQIDIPINNGYINSLYKSINIISKNIENNIPTNLIYNNIKLTFYIDIELLKKHTGTLVIKKGTELATLTLYPIYYVGLHDFQNLNKVYLIKNTEINNTFTEVF